VLTTKEHILCFVISDLHVDSSSNMAWVKSKCGHRPINDDTFSILIVPGDVGSEIENIDQVFGHLTKQYDAVCFTPGNHELWNRGSKSLSTNSFQKFSEVISCALKHGVYTSPLKVKSPTKTVLVVPMFSWYHSSWDTEPDITNNLVVASEARFPFVDKWSDFTMCQWPEDIVNKRDFANTSREDQSNQLPNYFASLNEPYLLQYEAGQNDNSPCRNDVRVNHLEESENTTTTCRNRCEADAQAQSEILREDKLSSPGVDGITISFSHFVPRQELSIEKRFLMEPFLSRVSGSNALEAQIRRLKPQLHLFGHTHIPIDLNVEGIRYIQWPLGYAR